MKATSTILKTSAICLMAIGTLSVTVSSVGAKHRRYKYRHHRMATVKRHKRHVNEYRGHWQRFRKGHRIHHYWHIDGDHYYYRHGHWYTRPNKAQKRHNSAKKTNQNYVTQMEKQTLRSINKDRASKHVKKLRETKALHKLATMRARDSARINRLSHTDNKGRLLYLREAHRNHIRLGGYSGENLAGAGIGNIQMDTNPHIYNNHNGKDMAKMDEDEMVNHDADSNWGHRYNMLNPNYRYVGVCVKHRNGTNNYYVAENFSN